MATIVTAFVTRINDIHFRTTEKYMELGKILLSQPLPTICFLEKYMYDAYFADCLEQFPNTDFQMFERHENYLMEHTSEMMNFQVESDNPSKDTIGYMFTQCHKTEWMKMAIEKNPFHTTDFIWIDFGIFHMIRKDSAIHFPLYLENMTRKTYDTIRIASCIDPREECKSDIYHKISWFFAGSVFGGSSLNLLKFAAKMKTFCLNMIATRRHLMWEINIWYLLYKEEPGLFEPYSADHNITILGNY